MAPKDSNQKLDSSGKVNYNILSHLKKIPAQLSVYEALLMSKDLRETLIQALKDPETYRAIFAEKYMIEMMQTQGSPAITFPEEDLLLGTVEHNRPLYVTAESYGIKIDRILIDPGSSVNLLSFKALRRLSLDIQHLDRDEVTVHGFNGEGQMTLGSFVLPLKFDNLHTEAKIHVIDVDTSFKALLGRPWLHEYGIVPSTMHQCMKYLKNGEEFIIFGDLQPFSTHEAEIYEDVKYFIPKESKTAEPSKVTTSSSGAKNQPKMKEMQKQNGRKKATPTLPKAVKATPKLRRPVHHLGSDTETEEDEIIVFKPKEAPKPSGKADHEIKESKSDHDLESALEEKIEEVASADQ